MLLQRKGEQWLTSWWGMGEGIAARGAGSDRKRQYLLPLCRREARGAKLGGSLRWHNDVKMRYWIFGDWWAQTCQWQRGTVLQQERNACIWTAPAGLRLFSSYSVHLIDRKKIRPFPQLAKAQRKYLAGISKSRMALRNCSLNLKHFDQDGYCFIS